MEVPPNRQPSKRREPDTLESEVVREYALRVAAGVCQGCEDEAPFVGNDGEPYLEVHHLYRRSDGGPDHPDNIVALCPNCHRRVHHGKDGDEFNQERISRVYKETIDPSGMTINHE
jgi:5-methylcytosine-specific restriction enzyme A